MFYKSVDGITASLNKLVTDLEAVATRESKNADVFFSEAAAQASYGTLAKEEASKALRIADKVKGLLV
jgi:hypothetical protein